MANPEVSKKPLDTAVRQQRLKGWHPILDPVWVIAGYFIIAVSFIPTGFVLQAKNNDIVELSVTYDDYNDENSLCKISSPNEGKSCQISFEAPKDMEPPILVHYGLTNFHQNYNRYSKSRDTVQLRGEINRDDLTRDPCKPLRKLGDIELNPCGLMANTFFNDIITLSSGKASDNSDLIMIEDGIAWKSDVEYSYAQPNGFKSEECNDCDNCDCDDGDWSCEEPYVDEYGTCYRYYYPNDDTTQYLYETYPSIISPLEGVTNEHFIVWMREATLPTFRKLYGYIDQPIAKGEEITFYVTANFEIDSFKGSKRLYLSTNNFLGGKNDYIGPFFYSVGFVSLGLGVLFGLKQWRSPRKLGDTQYLKFKTN